MNIYVSNLGFNVIDEDLKELFATYGEVTSAKVITDRETGRSRGFAFVEMSSDKDGKAAITGLNGGVLDGRDLRVTEARPKEEKSFNNNNKKSFRY